MAGIGGRGVLLAGLLFVRAGSQRYQHVSWMPSYSAAMRGGPCEATVILSDTPIASPMLVKSQSLIVMESSQLGRYVDRVRRGGLLIIESAGLRDKVARDDIQAIYLPAIEKSVELGDVRVGNLILLGAYIKLSGAVAPELIEAELEKRMGGASRQELLATNKRALRLGMELAAQG